MRAGLPRYEQDVTILHNSFTHHVLLFHEGRLKIEAGALHSENFINPDVRLLHTNLIY